MEEILQRSEAFHQKNPFPIHSVRLKELIRKHPDKIPQMEEFARTARPIVHEDVLDLITEFLKWKREKGSKIEKGIYKELTLPEFVHRLLWNRPLVFIGQRDAYLLRDGQGRGKGGFDNIGKDGAEKYPLIMENYLTYDEIKISALLGTSSHTLSINKGDRDNSGVVEEDQSNFVNEALLVGLVGPRLKKDGFMEAQDLVLRKSFRKNKANNCHHLYEALYKVHPFPSYEEGLKMKDRMIRLTDDRLFDSSLYKRRIELGAETLLFEANDRASKLKKNAYVHIVGLGLGLWRLCKEQKQLYVDVFGEVVSKNNLSYISDLDFSWIPINTVYGARNNEVINSVRIHISKRNFFEPLGGEDSEKLLVVSWAYDGNSYPGNEFWKGSLSGSGDSQAASSTQVSELQNPQINPWFSGDSLHVVSSQGVYKYKDFMNKFRAK